MSDQWPLIRRLAVEVMGWPVLTTFEAVGLAVATGKDGYVAEVDAPGLAAVVSEPYASLSGSNETWNPFEDVAAAWLLVEAFRERGGTVTLQALPEPMGGRCRATIHLDAYRGAGGVEAWGSAAEAICRAALNTLPEEAPHG